MSPAASAELSKRPTGPEFGLGDGAIGMNHTMGKVVPLQAFREKNIYEKFMLLSSTNSIDSRRKMFKLGVETQNTWISPIFFA